MTSCDDGLPAFVHVNIAGPIVFQSELVVYA